MAARRFPNRPRDKMENGTLPPARLRNGGPCEQICYIFERNLVQGSTSEVVGRGQAKELCPKPSRPLLKKAAISSSRRASAKETPSHQPEAWDDWGDDAVQLLISGRALFDPVIHTQQICLFPMIVMPPRTGTYGIWPTCRPPPFPPRSAVQSVSPDRIPMSDNSLHASFGGPRPRPVRCNTQDWEIQSSNGSGFVTIIGAGRTSTPRAWTDRTTQEASRHTHLDALTEQLFGQKQSSNSSRSAAPCPLLLSKHNRIDVGSVAGDASADVVSTQPAQTRTWRASPVCYGVRVVLELASVVEAPFFLEEREGLTGGRLSVGHRDAVE